MSATARLVHQITDGELATAPRLSEVWPAFMASLQGKATIVTFNVDFDTSTLLRDAGRYGLDVPTFDWQCLMLKYAEYIGEWSEYWGDYRWQSLPGGDHPAPGDGRAALEVMRHMAAHLTKLEQDLVQEEVQ